LEVEVFLDQKGVVIIAVIWRG